MKRYEVEISYPHKDKEEGVQLENLAAEEVLEKFHSLNWSQLLILQLQMQADSTTFTVTDSESEQSIQISLNEFAASHQLEFKLDSDIEVAGEKNLFGLFSYKAKDYVSFRELSLKQVQSILNSFVSGEIESIKQQYQHSSSQTDPASTQV